MGDSEREFASNLLADGCPIAEVARTLGVRSRVIVRWFPDAPRCTPTQKGEYAQLHKLEVAVMGR